MRSRGLSAATLCLAMGTAACGGKGGPTGGADEPGGGGGGGGGDEPAEPPGPPLPAAPADFDRAELVTVSDGTLTGWSLAGGKVEKLGSVTLAAVDAEDYTSQLSIDWVDHDHLAVLVPPRDVVLVSSDRLRRVAVPTQSAFQTPRPTVEDDDGLTEGGVMEGTGMGMTASKGVLWWVECPWGYPYDGWQCEVYTRAQLWPQAGAVETGDVQGDPWTWPSAAPDGFRLKELDDGRKLGCTPPAGTKQKQSQLAGFEEEGEMVQESIWVSVSPPRLLVVWGTPGLDDLVPVRWTLHDGCLEKPLAQGTAVEPGPDGLWLAHESTDPRAENVKVRTVIRRGADVIGEVEEIGYGYAEFRPARD